MEVSAGLLLKFIFLASHQIIHNIVFVNLMRSLGNHKLTATAKVIVKICEHEVGVFKRIIHDTQYVVDEHANLKL